MRYDRTQLMIDIASSCMVIGVMATPWAFIPAGIIALVLGYQTWQFHKNARRQKMVDAIRAALEEPFLVDRMLANYERWRTDLTWEAMEIIFAQQKKRRKPSDTSPQ